MDRIQLATVALAGALFLLYLWTLPSAPREASAPAPRLEAAAARPAPRSLARALPAGMAGPGSAAPGVPLERVPDLESERAGLQAARSWEIENDVLRVSVGSLGGRLERVALLKFEDRIGPGARPVELVSTRGRGTLVSFLGDGALAGFETANFSEVKRGREFLELRAERDGIRVERRLSLDPSGYGARLRISIANRGTGVVRPEFRVAMYAAERPPDAPDRFSEYSLLVSSRESVNRTAVSGLGSPSFFGKIMGQGNWKGDEYPDVEWVGVGSQYFLAAAVAENPNEARGFEGPIGKDAGVVLLGYPGFEVPAGRFVERSYRLYLGPKLESQVAAVDPRLTESIDFGWSWIRPIVAFFASLLVWIHFHVVSNYGLAIILLTIVLRLLTFPLSQKSMKSMQRLGKIAPEMKQLQEKFKDDREKLQAEMMSLYRKKGMNPLSAMGGGCIPMLIQMPFLISLFFALRVSMDLRHAPFFGWIQDLSAPETLFSIGPIPVRVLPLLMGASMLLQQRLSPSQGADPQQRQMMQWMSVMFIFLFYQFPSGLVLYWFTSNLLGILQQMWINREGRAEA